MNKKNRVIAFLLVFLIFPVFAFGSNQRPVTHTIIGHGSLLGDLFIPYAVHMDDDHYYALDMEGLTIFSRDTAEAITKFRVDTGLPELITSFFMMIQRMALVEDVEVFNEYFEELDPLTLMHLINLDMFVDGKHAYIHSLQGIHQYDLETERKTKTIPFPEFIDPDSGDLYLYHSPQYLEGVIYYLLLNDLDFDIFEMNENPIQNAQLLTYHLNTEETTIRSLSFCEDLDLSFLYGFAVAENGNITALALTDNGIELMLFDPMGNCLDTLPILNLLSMDLEIPLCITYLDDDYLAISSFVIDLDMEDYSLSLSNRIKIYDTSNHKLQEYLVHELPAEMGLLPTRISGYGDHFLLVSTGELNRLPDFSITHWSVDWNRASLDFERKVGESPYAPGQVFGSFSFAIDDKGHLYHNNFMINTIDVFDPDGSIVDVVYVTDAEYFSDFKAEEGFDMPVIITHLIIRENSLYVILLWGDVLEYSLDSGDWTTLHEGYDIYFGAYACNEGLHLFNPEIMYGDYFTPYVVFINADGEKDKLKLDYTFFSQKGPDGFSLPLDFIVNETEYHVLDSLNNAILIFDRKEGNLKEKVKINRIFNFPTSFDFHPEEDTEWMVNDMRSQVLLGVSRRGTIDHQIGGWGVLAKRLTVEDYQARNNRFYAPIRLRVQNDDIYVLDFLNCRYHRIALLER